MSRAPLLINYLRRINETEGIVRTMHLYFLHTDLPRVWIMMDAWIEFIQNSLQHKFMTFTVIYGCDVCQESILMNLQYYLSNPPKSGHQIVTIQMKTGQNRRNWIDRHR